MNEALNLSVRTLEEKFGGVTREFRGDLSVTVSPENIVEVCKTLREKLAFEQLADLTAVDYWPQMDPRMHLVYNFLSVSKNIRLEVRVPLAGDALEAPTVESVYFNANWHEREIYDMFGVRFTGHSDLRRILMPHDWEGHPLRKDYPLGYEEVQFSFNYDEIDKKKPYVKE